MNKYYNIYLAILGVLPVLSISMHNFLTDSMYTNSKHHNSYKYEGFEIFHR